MSNNKQPFNPDKWHSFFNIMASKPSLHRYEEGYGFEKKYYHHHDFRLILFRYDNGRFHLLLFEGDKLEIEGHYEDQRFYVTSRTMLRKPFMLFQEEVVAFMEQFAENEKAGVNDRLVINSLKKDMRELHRTHVHPSIRQEAQDLWHYYCCNQKRMAYVSEMKEAIRYLLKQTKINQNDSERRERYEDSSVHDQK